MTLEQLHQIRTRWLLRGQEATPAPGLDEALAEIERLLCEIERLQICCQEITRQYARLCHVNAQPGKKAHRDAPNVAVSCAMNSIIGGAD